MKTPESRLRGGVSPSSIPLFTLVSLHTHHVFSLIDLTESR